jgi:radical SAM protein with 4Fe4S-binding SPASM domain
LLIERGLPVSLKAMAITSNVQELGAMAELAERQFGVPFRFDAMINCRIDCRDRMRPLAVRLTPEHVVALDLAYPERIAEWRRFAEQFGGRAAAAAEAGRLYHCGAGVQAFAVDPAGCLRLCMLSQGRGYDLRLGSFREGWEALAESRAQPSTRTTKCTTCQIMELCGMCPAIAELETGDPQTPVEYLCDIAHRRCAALDIAVPAHGDCGYCPGGTRHADSVGESETTRVSSAFPPAIGECLHGGRPHE